MLNVTIETKLILLSNKLRNNGFEKEAGLLDSFRMKAMSGLAALSIITGMSQLDILNLSPNVISSANQIESNNDIKEIVVDNDNESLTSIIQKHFPNAEYPDGLAAMALKQNPTINGVNDKIAIGTKVIIPDYYKLHNSLNSLLESNGLMPINDIYTSESAIDHILSVEKFSKYAYDDAKPNVIWSHNKKASGNWTIGFGHLLTKSELSSGLIDISGETFDWKNGLSNNDAKKVFIKDLSVKENDVKQILKKTGYSFITQSKFDALVDFTYNSGRRSLFNILSETRTLNNLTSELANYKINNNAYGGLYSRRISQILKIHNIYLSKDDIDKLTLKIGGFDSIKDPGKMRRFLQLISNNEKIKSADDLKYMIEIVANR